MRRVGTVSLVGAGPGDPELMTVGAVRRLRAAEVVVYDRLIDPRVLDQAPARAERIFVGKAAGRASMSQRDIERVLIDRALAGRNVVRLKGGDPFLFGRGGEEVEALAAAGIPYEVVPGVSSALAVPASAGIPVTHRRLASSLTVITGHEDPEKFESSIDWDWAARTPGTLVILMGLVRIEAISARLLQAGRSGDTPAAAVSAGTLPQERSIFSKLSALPGAVGEAGLRSPAIIIIGEVVRFPALVAASDLRSLAAAM